MDAFNARKRERFADILKKRDPLLQCIKKRKLNAILRKLQRNPRKPRSASDIYNPFSFEIICLKERDGIGKMLYRNLSRVCWCL